MNKTELVDAVAKASGLKKADAETAIDAAFNAIINALKNKEEVRLLGFGSFVTTQTKATTGRNPRTGEPIDVPAKWKAKFRPGKQISEALENL
ncbi:MAG: DNA-binding protein HRL53 [Holosporales bacterium]